MREVRLEHLGDVEITVVYGEKERVFSEKFDNVAHIIIKKPGNRIQKEEKP